MNPAWFLALSLETDLDHIICKDGGVIARPEAGLVLHDMIEAGVVHESCVNEWGAHPLEQGSDERARGVDLFLRFRLNGDF